MNLWVNQRILAAFIWQIGKLARVVSSVLITCWCEGNRLFIERICRFCMFGGHCWVRWVGSNLALFLEKVLAFFIRALGGWLRLFCDGLLLSCRRTFANKLCLFTVSLCLCSCFEFAVLDAACSGSKTVGAFSCFLPVYVLFMLVRLVFLECVLWLFWHQTDAFTLIQWCTNDDFHVVEQDVWNCRLCCAVVICCAEKLIVAL